MWARPARWFPTAGRPGRSAGSARPSCGAGEVRRSWRPRGRRWIDQTDRPSYCEDPPGELVLAALDVDDMGRIAMQRAASGDHPGAEVDRLVDLGVLGLEARRLGLEGGTGTDALERGLVIGREGIDESARNR